MWKTHSLSLLKQNITFLQKLSLAPSTPQGIAMRAHILLESNNGMSNSAIAREYHVSRPTIVTWKSRYKENGVDGIMHIAKGRGRKPKIEEQKIDAIIYDTLHTTPEDATHWSTRSLAKKNHVSHDFIKKVWQEHGLKPWLVETFKVSNDPHFIDKLKDVVGLYLNPPEHALVFSLDERTQIQALDRTPAALPLAYGKKKTVTHDYKRNGTTSLFAALDILRGKIIGSCMQRHRHQEFIAFLDKIDQTVPAKYMIHCIVDNYSTHKHVEVKAWLKAHPRFYFHFIPTSSSWLNLVERWFGEITRKRIRRGVFHSVKELIDAIDDYIHYNNQHPKPFIWTKTADEILAKVNACKSILPTSH